MDSAATEDLARLRAIAEEGREAPLLGGWHLILWGSAIAIALLINWAVAERILNWPEYSLAFSWFGIVLASWAGSALLGRRQRAQAGACSIGNQVERGAWVTAGAFLFILSLAIFFRALTRDDPGGWDLFALMPPTTFGAYAIALQASVIGSGRPDGRIYAPLALAFAALTAFLIGDPRQYLAAALGVALVAIPAGIRHLNHATRSA
jgi:hypothetical protein